MSARGSIVPRNGDDGAFTLDADMLAASFGWSVEEMRELMRRGLVTSMVERGEGDDRGRWRLSVRCGNRRWRAIVEEDGAIADSQVDFIASRDAPETASG